MAKLVIEDRFKGSTVRIKRGNGYVVLKIDEATQSQLKELQALGHPAVTEAKPKPPKEGDVDR